MRGTVLIVCGALAAGTSAGCGGDADSTTTAATQDMRSDAVEIVDFEFDPDPVSVAVGTELTWTNDDSAPHTATADDGSFDTGDLDHGDSGRVSLNQPGTYTYYCRFHPFMKGTVEVR